MADLPEEIQKIYDSLHLTEKQFEVLDDFLKKALLAIENRPKYEKALAEIVNELRSFEEVGQYCEKCDHYDEDDESCDRISSVECKRHMINYYKKLAGFAS